MKNVFVLLFLWLALGSWAQLEFYLEAYPSEQELVALNAMETLTRNPQQYLDEDNHKCEGRIKYFRKGRDIDIRPIGEWKHYYPSGKTREVALFDDKGNILERFSFDQRGGFTSDSRFEYRKLEGETYRIERYTAYNATGKVVRKEYWYSTISYMGAFLEVSIPKKLGFWEEFDDTGKPLAVKEFKPKLALDLGLAAR